VESTEFCLTVIVTDAAGNWKFRNIRLFDVAD
jgi:hypothetical protein